MTVGSPRAALGKGHANPKPSYAVKSEALRGQHLLLACRQWALDPHLPMAVFHSATWAASEAFPLREGLPGDIGGNKERVLRKGERGLCFSSRHVWHLAFWPPVPAHPNAHPGHVSFPQKTPLTQGTQHMVGSQGPRQC